MKFLTFWTVIALFSVAPHIAEAKELSKVFKSVKDSVVVIKTKSAGLAPGGTKNLIRCPIENPVHSDQSTLH